MEVTRHDIIYIKIDNKSDIGVCRRKAVGLSKLIGFDEIKNGEVAIMVTELATNVLEHGGGKGGMLVCHYENIEQQKALEIWCCDEGKGILNPEESITDGFTNKKSLGIGLGSIQRFSDEFEINPPKAQFIKDLDLPDFGENKNCIRTLKWVPKKQWIGNNRNLIVGAASRSKPGERLNGDTYIITHLNQHKTVAAIVDGLGHGNEANKASQMVKERLLLRPELPLDALMMHIHSGIRGTRGAVVGLLSADTENNKLFYTGIGNIEGFLFSSGKKKNLISFGGIVGHNMRTPRIFDFNFNPGDYLCLYTDGITSRWNSKDIDWEGNPQYIAEYILTHYSRQNDDATVFIIRYNV